MPRPLPEPVARGKRVVLRPLDPRDDVALVANLQSPEISRWTASIPYPYTLMHGEAFIRFSREQAEAGTGRHLAICDAERGDLVGVIGIDEIANGQAVVGYWVGKAYWGQGVATEAVETAVEWAFRELGLRRVRARVYAGNAASIRVLERVGFEAIGREPGPPGKPEALVYARNRA